MKRSDDIVPKQVDEEYLQRPKTLLTEEEIAEGDRLFVELIIARDKLIEQAKRTKQNNNAIS